MFLFFDTEQQVGKEVPCRTAERDIARRFWVSLKTMADDPLAESPKPS